MLMIVTAYLGSREFAERLGIVPETLRRWVRSGRVTPAGRTPTGQLRFTEAQVAEVLAGPRRLTERAQDIEAHVLQAREEMRRLRREL